MKQTWNKWTIILSYKFMKRKNYESKHIKLLIKTFLIKVFLFHCQLFISGEETQGPQLLSTIIQRPNLGGLLGPHFTPVAGGASTFLQMYQTVVDLSTGSNVDLCFVLLSKVNN